MRHTQLFKTKIFKLPILILRMRKILVVDDETSVRQTERIILESEGYEVSEASDADEAWLSVQKDAPDLILLDIRMPGMPAIELVKKIKSSPSLRKIRIVYVTAIVGTKEFTKKVEGVIDALEKPFKNEDLIKTVKEALSIEII